jgi:hypothetical protein
VSSSGGALASEWASELQKNYAPEFPLIGMTSSGITPNVINVINTINKRPFAGIATVGFLELGNAYPDFGAYVQQSLVPEKAAQFNTAGQMRFYAGAVAFAKQEIYQYFKQGQAIFDCQYPCNKLEREHLYSQDSSQSQSPNA